MKKKYWNEIMKKSRTIPDDDKMKFAFFFVVLFSVFLLDNFFLFLYNFISIMKWEWEKKLAPFNISYPKNRKRKVEKKFRFKDNQKGNSVTHTWYYVCPFAVIIIIIIEQYDQVEFENCGKDIWEIWNFQKIINKCVCD